MNNAYIIKDFNKIDSKYLHNSYDWDLLEFKFSLDSNKLLQWYLTLREKYYKSIFSFDKHKSLVDNKKSLEQLNQGKFGLGCKTVDAITISWPIERDDPLPPPSQCNQHNFPEVNFETFFDDAKIMPRYNFGYFQNLINCLGEDSFRQTVVVWHYPGMKLSQHQDGKIPLKMHIPIKTNPEAYFVFGKDGNRKCHMEVGKAYILNSGAYHGTVNPKGDRIHLYSRIAPNKVDDLLKIEGEI